MADYYFDRPDPRCPHLSPQECFYRAGGPPGLGAVDIGTAPSFIWPTQMMREIYSWEKFGAKAGKHTGLDFGKLGNPVVAAAGGTVRYVGDMLAGGWAVWIDHGGGWQTRYLHLMPGSIVVKKGHAVTQGQQIARVGHSGLERAYGEEKAPAAAHLHFEVRKDGTPVDPESVLSSSKVNLATVALLAVAAWAAVTVFGG
jgi:murein DD-endopeptidase MepM/ murein hydrolase activator NlpD